MVCLDCFRIFTIWSRIARNSLNTQSRSISPIKRAFWLDLCVSYPFPVRFFFNRLTSFSSCLLRTQLFRQSFSILYYIQSLGGAVAMATYMEKPSLWGGVVFICPMCRFSEKMMPSPILLWLLRFFCGPPGSKVNFFGLLPFTPTSGIKYSFKVPYHKLLVDMAPNITGRKMRLASAREMLAGTAYVSTKVKEFDAPFLILHGKADKVIGPEVSVGFYEESPSKDKEIKLYEGMWHNITAGETQENIDMVHSDVIEWILARA
mmetsp:Transcript_22994/g.35178  ORF Transcript_22994/g.35178 Transcript_22994/m.35178 type:complete len:262 (+) Transcript_22994:868-1653(+)